MAVSSKNWEKLLRQMVVAKWKPLSLEQRAAYYEAASLGVPRKFKQPVLNVDHDNGRLEELLEQPLRHRGAPPPVVPTRILGPENLSPDKLKAIGKAFIVHGNRLKQSTKTKSNAGTHFTRLQACCFNDAKLTKSERVAHGASANGLFRAKSSADINFDELPGTFGWS